MKLIFVIAILTSTALAQDVPPPPKPPSSGPSLEVTMSFIQERLASIGRVNFVAYGHDDGNGTDWTDNASAEATSVQASAASCRVDYHWHATDNGASVMDKDARVSLKAVQEVLVETLEHRFADVERRDGRPERTYRVAPPVFVLLVKSEKRAEDVFYLYDETLANRIAKALVHAVELCGGGSKPEPF
jgi:hypothetical protein